MTQKRKLCTLFKRKPLVPIIRLEGVIGQAGRFSSGISDKALAFSLQKAFTRGKPAAIALLINSPGGSPVQSSLIAARIRRLAKEKNIPVHAFVEDVAASGGYWIASAADHIWVDAASLVGSIGVVSASFGFHEFLHQHGIERRLYTAGNSKSLLDPFLPEKPEDVARLKHIQQNLHTLFIQQIQQSRNGRLDSKVDLFQGDIWLGQEAVALGLVDGIAHLEDKMAEIVGETPKFRIYGARKSWLSFVGAQVTDGVAMQINEYIHKARYGL